MGWTSLDPQTGGDRRDQYLAAAPAASFSPHRFNPFRRRSGIPVGDFNGDGRADLAFGAVQGNGGGEDAIWLRNGCNPIGQAIADPDHHVGLLFA